MRKLAISIALGALASPASALGADTYVDQGTGADAANDCSAQASPCKTILKGIAQAGTGETVFVNGGHTYGANLVLDDGKSLVHKDFAGTGGTAILDGGSDTAHYEVDVQGSAGKVSGFTIRGEGGPVKAGAPVKFSHDVFDEDAAIADDVRIDATGKVVIDNDTFSDPTPSTVNSDFQVGVSGGPGTLVVKHSSFTGFSKAVGTSIGGTATIVHNDIAGTHGQDTSTGAAISAVNATVAHNTIHDPGAKFSDGIDASAGVDIANNYIEAGLGEGVYDVSSGAKLTLENNVILGGTAVSTGSDVRTKGTNLTLLGTSFGAHVSGDAKLTLDSSIVGGGGIAVEGAGTCSIKYSRGPVKHAGGDGCKDFSTTKSPKFKSDGYHLKGSSPLIDRGNPHKPPKHTKDIDGDKRALAGDCNAHHAKKRRDIGADEFKCSKGHHH